VERCRRHRAPRRFLGEQAREYRRQA
jgi:hypothetical protein